MTNEWLEEKIRLGIVGTASILLHGWWQIPVLPTQLQGDCTVKRFAGTQDIGHTCLIPVTLVGTLSDTRQLQRIYRNCKRENPAICRKFEMVIYPLDLFFQFAASGYFRLLVFILLRL